jgi:hypothetical protein
VISWRLKTRGFFAGTPVAQRVPLSSTVRRTREVEIGEKKMRLRSTLMGLTALAFIAGAANATPGFIALEGSDATAFHHDESYGPQLFKYLQGGSALNVLVLGTVTGLPNGGIGTTYVTSLTGVDLSNYSALYIESPGGCCTANPHAIDGFGSAVSAFIAAGGNFSIENYVGGGYDGVVPGGDGTNASNVWPTYFCSDRETVSAQGIAHGFSQPPVDGCWSHQAYANSYWAPLGYINLMNADPTYFGAASNSDPLAGGSSFLALGGTLGNPTPGVPEPLTLSVFGIGLAGLWASRRKRKSS